MSEEVTPHTNSVPAEKEENTVSPQNTNSIDHPSADAAEINSPASSPSPTPGNVSSDEAAILPSETSPPPLPETSPHPSPSDYAPELIIPTSPRNKESQSSFKNPADSASPPSHDEEDSLSRISDKSIPQENTITPHDTEKTAADSSQTVSDLSIKSEPPLSSTKIDSALPSEAVPHNSTAREENPFIDSDEAHADPSTRELSVAYGLDQESEQIPTATDSGMTQDYGRSHTSVSQAYEDAEDKNSEPLPIGKASSAPDPYDPYDVQEASSLPDSADEESIAEKLEDRYDHKLEENISRFAPKSPKIWWAVAGVAFLTLVVSIAYITISHATKAPVSANVQRFGVNNDQELEVEVIVSRENPKVHASCVVRALDNRNNETGRREFLVDPSQEKTKTLRMIVPTIVPSSHAMVYACTQTIPGYLHHEPTDQLHVL